MIHIPVGRSGEGSTKQENPAGGLFADMPVHEQRQALRWLIQEPDTALTTPHLGELLRAALRASDVEVRVTALLAAARLRAGQLLPEIHAANPATGLRHLEGHERRFYGLLWTGVLQYLQRQRHPSDTVPGGDPLLPLWHVLAGTLEVTDETSLLLHALTTPLEQGQRPRQLPPGVLERDGQYFLRHSGLALRWIAPIAHWVGAQRPRRVRSEGFFVAQVPVSRALATWMDQADPTQHPAAPEQAWLGSFEEAARLCRVLSRIEQLPLRLPTADEWEMVVRGPDGRRFPWGNLPERDGEQRSSPWGAEHLVGDMPEWTFEAASALPLLRGGVESRTWVRHASDASWDELAGTLRFVIPTTPPAPVSRHLQ